MPLRYTPRRCEVNPLDNTLVICESDHNSFNADELLQLRKTVGCNLEGLTDAQIGVPAAGEGRWGTCIRVVDPVLLETKHLWELQGNETIVSCCLATFVGHESTMFLVLGIVSDFVLQPRAFSSASIVVLSVTGSYAEVHRTSVEDIPLSICPFYGRLLVGVGNKLRLYELGRQRLLKKGEDKVTFPMLISHIKVDGERIFACDISESFTVLRWHAEDQQFLAIADDVAPRWVTSACLLDHDTLAATDKFENFIVLRIPPQCDDEEEMAPSMRQKWEAGYLGGAFYKLDLICQFFLGDLATSLVKAKLSDGAAEVLVYGTSMGAIGVLLPLTRKEDVEFFVHLEMYLRSEVTPLCGREHLAYRSSYAPVKNVVDGDLCEFFPKLDVLRQRTLAEEIEHSPAEVHKRLEDIRNLVV
jgi:splicing factor 3B subunit 3